MSDPEGRTDILVTRWGSRGGAFLSGKDFEPPLEQYVSVAMIPIATHRDYFVAITQEGGGPDCFCWELRHRKTPMGVKVWVHGFRSPEAAEVAGKTALAEFLEGLSIEESLGA
jgi:hypothetical protein